MQILLTFIETILVNYLEKQTSMTKPFANELIRLLREILFQQLLWRNNY